jgi:hypothetical protein
MLQGQDKAFLLIVAAIVSFVILLPTIFGSASSNLRGQVNTAVSTPMTTTTSLDSRISTLEVELLASREANDRLYSTVWGTLQTVGAVVSILAVFTWFQNRLSYDRDRQSMQTELQNAITKEINVTKVDLVAQNAVLVDDLERKFEDRAKTRYKQAEEQVAQVTQSLNSSFEKLRNRLHFQQFDLMEMQIEQMKVEGAWENVFDYAQKLLKLAKEMEDDISIVISLQYIEDAVAQGAGRSPHKLGTLYQLLESLSGMHSAQVNTIRKLVDETLEASVRRDAAKTEDV